MEASSDEQETEDQAEVCRSRRWAIAAAAAVAVLIGGNGAWQLFDGDESVEKVHVAGPAHPSTGPVLEWTEFDPDVGDSDSLVTLEPLGDGRVLVRTLGQDIGGADSGYKFLVTENGVDWSEVPMPTEILPISYDLSSDRWLVAGYDSTGETRAVTEGAEDGSGQIFSSFRAFFSDDRGASWTEAEFDFSATSIEVPSTYEQLPYFISAALTSKEHMVIVLQSEEESGEIPKSWIMASEGGAFQQVAEYDGWILNGVIPGHISTPAGFMLQLLGGGGTRQGPPLPSTLTSPDGRIWNERKTANPFAPTALGPDGSLWRTSWLGTRYGLHRIDRKGTLKMEVAFDNSLPFQVAAGPSGLAVSAMTVPGTELFTLPDQRIAKDEYELRLNVPEGGFSLWHLETGAAVYECGQEFLWAWFGSSNTETCEFRYPMTNYGEMDSVVLAFDDPQTGGELVSFTREELLPAFPLWTITWMAVDGLERRKWLGWSADGVEWGWQSPADAFRIDPPSEANEASIQLAVGDGFVLALVQRWSQHPLPTQSWFMARVP